MELKGTNKAYITNDWTSPEELKELMEQEQGAKAVSRLAFSEGDVNISGWTCVGQAEISVSLFPPKALLASKISSLRNELEVVRANHQVKVQDLEGKINSLLALPNLIENEIETESESQP